MDECDEDIDPGPGRARRQLTNWDRDRLELDAINTWQGTAASTHPGVAPIYEYQRAALEFRVQMEQWGQMFFEEAFFLPGGALSASAQAWVGMDDRDWVVGLGSAMLDGSDGGAVITPTEINELGLARPVERRNATSVPVAMVAAALHRWNSTVLSAFGQWFGTTTNVIDLAVWVPAVAAFRLDANGTDRFVALVERHAAVVDAAVTDSPRACARIEHFPQPPQLSATSTSAAQPVVVVGSVTVINVCDEPLVDVAVVVRLLQPATTTSAPDASDAAPNDGSDGAEGNADSGSGDEGSGSGEEDEGEDSGGDLVLRLSVAPVPAETSSVIEWSLPPQAIAVTDEWTVGVSLRFGVGSGDLRYSASFAPSPIAAARTSTTPSTTTSSAPLSTEVSARQTAAATSEQNDMIVTSTTLAVEQAAGGSSSVDDDGGVSAGGIVAIVFFVVIAVVGAGLAYDWAKDNSSGRPGTNGGLAPAKHWTASTMNPTFADPSAKHQQPSVVSSGGGPNALEAHLLASSAMASPTPDTLASGASRSFAETDALDAAPLWGKQLSLLSETDTADTDVDADGTGWAAIGQTPGTGEIGEEGRKRVQTLEPSWSGAEGTTTAASAEELLVSSL